MEVLVLINQKRFDFEEISKYYKSSELEQLIGSSARIKKNGVVNTMILANEKKV
jgi:hypothetical protein